MATIWAADSFTRAGGSSVLGTAEKGGAWTSQVGIWDMYNNQGSPATPTNDAYNIATLSVAQADCVVSCDVTTSTNASRTTAGLALRYADGNNWLRLLIFKEASVPNSLYLQQTVGGSATTLANVDSMGFVDGGTYNLKAVISRATMTVYVNNLRKITAAFDATLTTQKYGLVIYKATTTFDDGVSKFDNFLVTTEQPTSRMGRVLSA